MTGRRRRELTDSFGLVAGEERWFLRDLAVGAVAFVVWVAGTGAIATRAAGALDVPFGLASGESPSLVTVAVFALCWLVLPALAVAVRIRGRMLNLRGNVHQYYRLDHPAALLAPPALLVAAVCVVAFVVGRVPWYVAFATIPIGLFLLVRTLAYSYRVYAFSHPGLVLAAVFASVAAMLGGALVAAATASGHGPLAETVLAATGVPGRYVGDVTGFGVTVYGPVLATVSPVVLATAYVGVQTVGALIVRVTRPTVTRSETRTGQRYPAFLPTAAAQTAVTASDGSDDSRPATDDSNDHGPGGANDGTGVAGNEGPNDGDEDPNDRKGDPDEAETDEADTDQANLDDVSNTRVFTPPAEDTDQAAEIGSDEEFGETRAVPASDGSEDGAVETERERCDACGQSFPVDAPVRFCPNCGAALEAE